MRIGIVAKPSNNTVIIVVRILNRTLEYSQCYISEQIPKGKGRKKKKGGKARTASLRALKRVLLTMRINAVTVQIKFARTSPSQVSFRPFF